MESDMLNEREAAEIIGVSRFTMNGWRHRRTGPSWISISARCVRYRRADLLAWLEARRVETSDSRRLAASRPDRRVGPEATR